MKKQKVPRKNIVDGLPLSIYKRCGWEAPISGLSERDNIRYGVNLQWIGSI